ncbi:MAG: hypothetical protein ABTQ25_02060 [Nitrosomonas ureae]
MARRQPKEYEDLPASLENAIEGMSVVDRGMIEGDDGEIKQRTMLMFASETVSSWHHDPTETRKRIKAGWPRLTDSQLAQAMRSINGRIRTALKQAAPHQQRNGWTSWRPLRETLYGSND